MAQARTTSKAIGAQNIFTDAIVVNSGAIIALTGTFSANVVLQKLALDNSTWIDVTYNDGTATIFTLAGTYLINGTGFDVVYRVGVKTGGYTSGAVNIEIQAL